MSHNVGQAHITWDQAKLDEAREQTQLLRSIRNMLTFIVIALVMFLVLGILSAAAA
jgi:hypothetical protein